MALPKRRTSKGKKGRRRSHHKIAEPKIIACKDCKQPVRPHEVCKSCGKYNGEQVLDI